MKEYSDFEIRTLTGKGTPCFSVKTPSYVIRLLDNFMLNDNSLVRTFLFPDTSNKDMGSLPNALNLTLSSSLPDNVIAFLSVLTKEHPLLKGCSTPDEALEFIRSRYDQYGSEVDNYVDFLESVLSDSQSDDAQSSGSSEPSK